MKNPLIHRSVFHDTELKKILQFEYAMNMATAINGFHKSKFDI